MKPTMSKDGRKRIDAKVNFRLDAGDMAVMIVTDLGPDENDDVDLFVTKTMKLSNRKLVEKAKATLRSYGDEVPHYRVSDQNLSKFADALERKLAERMFGESK